MLGHRVTTYLTDGLGQLGVTTPAGDEAIPQFAPLPGPIRAVVQIAYGHGAGDMFLTAAPFALVTLIAVIFIKEVPLRRQNGTQPPASDARHTDGGQALPATGTGVAR